MSTSMHERFVRSLETHVFRQRLKKHGVSGESRYEWVNGEALYRGEPISGRATESEAKAILEMQQLIAKKDSQ